VSHVHGPMNGNICSQCGQMASRGSAPCPTAEDEVAAAKVDTEMRAFSDEIRLACDVPDLLRPPERNQ
jgi:hypothetical protein